ncbi:MAG TPA: hypothetical protein VFO16_23080 [Pseudonocardiaceae bacterium]|nr:hypothetical protein [Pseudonocardiaceae bacterium]
MGGAIDPEPGDGRLDYSICPGVPCPGTVLVARMTGGGYLLMAYPHREPAAFVVSDDADLLRDALRAAFGYPTAEITSGTSNPAPQASVSPGKRVRL